MADPMVLQISRVPVQGFLQQLLCLTTHPPLLQKKCVAYVCVRGLIDLLEVCLFVGCFSSCCNVTFFLIR